jgi:hypothetical protein
LAVLDIPEIRTLLLNAVLWTARQDVPRTGATSTVPAIFPPLVEGTGPLPIPQGMAHNARNIGTEDAVLDVYFSSADRVAVGE